MNEVLEPLSTPLCPPQAVVPLRVGFILTEQFTLAAFAGFVDALRLAADPGGRSRPIHASWTVMSADGLPRRSSCGVSVGDLAKLADPAAFDYIAVCGGNDYLNRRPPADLIDYLKLAAAKGVPLLGVCTGTFIIAQAGLADGRCVCVHWNVIEAFRERFPLARPVVDRLFVDEGSLITCAGSTATIDMALYLVKRHCGDDKARQALRHMMLQDVRPASLPQPHFFADLSGITDLRVRKAAHFIEQRLDDPPRVETIARYVGISVRQLERAFEAALDSTPAAFQRRVRLDYARWLLSNCDRAVTQIASDCGFADGAHLSREFRAAFGVAPARFRRELKQQSASPPHH